MRRPFATSLALGAFSAFAVALLTVACSGNDGEGTTATSVTTSDGGTVQISAACAADNRKDIYTQGLTKPASDLSVQMTDSEFLPSGAAPVPGQVQKGMNTVTVLVLDANKAPVDGATVTLALLMPDHGHGSALTPTVTPQGGGKYQISNVWLSMAGLWQFTVSVLPPSASGPKLATFNFCIDG